MAALFLSRFWRHCPPSTERPIGEVLELANLELDLHCGYFRIAHGIRHQARELLVGCYRLARGRGHRGERRFLQHPSTPAALELFELWLQTGDGDPALVNAWREALRQPDAPLAPATPAPAGGRRRRRPRRRKPKHPRPEVL